VRFVQHQQSYTHYGWVVLIISGLLLYPVFAYDNRFPPFTPDRYDWHYQNNRRVVLPQKLNLNTATFNQLLTLPEVSEPIALAILAQRPFTNLADLDKLTNHFPKKRVEQVRQAISSRVKIEPPLAGVQSPLGRALIKTGSSSGNSI
jgi:hypothetical protein